MVIGCVALDCTVPRDMHTTNLGRCTSTVLLSVYLQDKGYRWDLRNAYSTMFHGNAAAESLFSALWEIADNPAFLGTIFFRILRATSKDGIRSHLNRSRVRLMDKVIRIFKGGANL